MKLITIDGKEWDVKYKQSKESISFSLGTSTFEYPDFVGSKLYHNSSSSNRYALTFAIHITLVQSLIVSIKKILINPNDAIEKKPYGKLTDIIIEHRIFGAIRGKILGEPKIDTSSEADVMITCLFQEHTIDEPLIKKDLEDENTNAVNAIDSETTTNFDVDLSAQDKSLLVKFSESLGSLYNNIQNSVVISTFNDLNAELSSTILDAQRVMNAFKKVLNLPNEIVADLTSSAKRIELLKEQAELIKTIPVSTYNMALFNANSFSYNMGVTSQTAFVSESALAASAGLKVVPLI
jgi:hypothetical protein